MFLWDWFSGLMMYLGKTLNISCSNAASLHLCIIMYLTQACGKDQQSLCSLA